MNVSEPILDVVPGARGRVLAALTTRAVGRLTGRELARLAGVPPSTTQRVVDDLVDAGIVNAQRLGAAVGYQLNSQHLVARAVIDLAQARLNLLNEIKKTIESWAVQPVAAWMYGSTARGDGDRHSDIDLLLVGPDDADEMVWERQIGALAARIRELTGNHAQIIEHTRASLLELERVGSPFIKSLRADGLDLVDSSWSRLR